MKTSFPAWFIFLTTVTTTTKYFVFDCGAFSTTALVHRFSRIDKNTCRIWHDANQGHCQKHVPERHGENARVVLYNTYYAEISTMDDDHKKNRNNDGAAKTTKSKSSLAVIGGGIAGLSCAMHLGETYDVTVYDTGRLRPGGRASSRQPGDPPKEDDDKSYPFLSRYRYDHAAQFISSPFIKNAATGQVSSSWRNGFDAQVQSWVEQGILQSVPPGSMYVLEKGVSDIWKPKVINAVDDGESTVQFYYPSEGMSSLPRALMKGGAFKVEQDVWVSPSSGVKYQPQSSAAAGRKWKVRAQGRVLGEYDQLILAHNGKCADRLMSQTPAQDVHSLLRVNFNDRVSANGGQKMTLNSLYSVTVCLKAPSALSKALPNNFLAGFIQRHPKLSMLSCQTKKYPPNTYSGTSSDEAEVWNILSSASFAKKHKAPQEFLPDDVIQNVTAMLIESLQEDVIGARDSENLLDQILDFRVQLWGAAVPMNVWRAKGSKEDVGAGFIYDPKYQVGVCGDWLLEPSIAGAWTSGERIARHLRALASNDAKRNEISKESIGVEGNFEASLGVQRLGIASLDGPMLSKNTRQPSQKSSSSRRRQNDNAKMEKTRKGRAE
jgi:predicted NAD/FAD-dependent oxidoreductase